MQTPESKQVAAIIDADTIVWVACYQNRERDHPTQMILDLDNFLWDMLVTLRATHYVGFVKGQEESFRHKAFPDYKANRPETPDWLKKWKPYVVKHLVKGPWQFEEVNGVEVDDAVASAHDQMVEHPIPTLPGCRPIICSQDKDFNQIPGWKYNPKTKKLTFTGGEEALDNLLTQILMGDATDNIKGVRGIGPAKAKRIILLNSEDKISAVVRTYLNQHNTTRKGLRDFVENAFKVILREDSSYPFTLRKFPEGFQQFNLEKQKTEINELFNEKA